MGAELDVRRRAFATMRTAKPHNTSISLFKKDPMIQPGRTMKLRLILRLVSNLRTQPRKRTADAGESLGNGTPTPPKKGLRAANSCSSLAPAGLLFTVTTSRSWRVITHTKGMRLQVCLDTHLVSMFLTVYHLRLNCTTQSLLLGMGQTGLHMANRTSCKLRHLAGT